MLRYLLTTLVCLVGLAEPGISAVVTPCQNPSTAACRYTKGLLWKIERPGQKPSYLFGTIHLADARVTTLPEPVRTAFETSRSFTMELIADGEGLMHIAETMFFNDGRTLETTIGAPRYAEVKQILVARGMPIDDLNRKKPWAVTMVLSMPPQKAGIALDFQLQMQATLSGKPTYGLETMREQISVFNDLPITDQIALLDATLRQQQTSAKLLERMTQAYIARDLTGIQAVMDASGIDDRRVHNTVMERLLANRNDRMLERMRERLAEGDAFIAVGAGHLPGEHGLLALLERAGWRISAIY